MRRKISAEYLGDNTCAFTVWAPARQKMALHLVFPDERKLEMQQDEWGYFSVTADDVPPGSRYFFTSEDEQDFPDPGSHYQPEGVHGPSEVIDHHSYQWHDSHWKGIPFKELILYELHVGTFTAEGTFSAIIPFLEDLINTGINAIEVMPVSQFPGNRNWGYDGVYPYAVQNTYGGPQGLKELVDACHQKGIAVFLDVVYNHLGPEGNHFGRFGPYFTNKYTTPWGDAVNFDDKWSDGVRDFFSENALYWFELYHIDGLRFDAIHAIFDSGAVHFWDITRQKVKLLEQRLGRLLHMIAESDLNSPKVVNPPDTGGYGFTAQWLDDFHHALLVLLDEKEKEHYADFGRTEQLAKAYTDGFVHSGEYVSFRKKKHGSSSAGIPGDKFVVFNQNHDQTGNRVSGERLSMLVDFERLKLAAAALLLSPYVPMLFMGEEYADPSPFLYFVSHSDKELITAVQQGRKKEFEDLKWEADPPDPQDEATFTRSKLQWHRRTEGKHLILLKWNKRLIELRKTNPILQNFEKKNIRADVLKQNCLVLHRQSGDGQHHLLCIFNLSAEPITYTFPHLAGKWIKLLDSKEVEWLETAEKISNIHPDKIGSDEQTEIEPLSITVYMLS